MRSQTVSINKESLFGDWLLPQNEPICAVFLFSGSGPTDADGNQPGLELNNLHDLAHSLASLDIASLRIDKRGVGRSRASLQTEAALSIETYAEDAVQWMNWLRQRHSDKPIFLVGHSEGSLIALMLAQRVSVAGVISLCAPVRPAADVLREQLAGRLPAHLEVASEAILRSLVQGDSCPICPDELLALYRPSVQPYLRSWFRYAPQELVSKLSCPHLWIWGDRDKQVINEWQHLKSQQGYLRIDQMDHAMHSPDEAHIVKQLIHQVSLFCGAYTVS